MAFLSIGTGQTCLIVLASCILASQGSVRPVPARVLAATEADDRPLLVVAARAAGTSHPVLEATVY